MNRKLIPVLILAALSLACYNTTMAQPVTIPASSPKLDTVVELIVTAEIGVQVRTGCGVNFPTTGIILTHGETVTAMGAAVVLPDMSLWQPIEQGCVNAAFVEPVK